MKRLIPLVLLGALAITSPAAAEVSADVKLDWDSFEITFIPFDGLSSGSFTWNEQNGSLSTYAATNNYAEEDSAFVDLTGFTSDGSIASSTAFANSSASRMTSGAPPTTMLEIFASADQGPLGDSFNEASAYGEQFGQLTLEGNGVFLFSVDWEMSLVGALGDSNNDATGSVYMGLSDDNDPNGFKYADTGTWRDTEFDGPGDYDGTLYLAFANQGTSEVWFYGGIETFANAQNIPEPGSLALALVGLIGLAWIGRRRLRG